MATEIWVNPGSGNGLLPDGTKPLPEPMLTRDYWHPSQCNFTENAQDMLAKIFIETLIFLDFYASAFRRRRHYVFGLSVRLSVRPSVRPKPEIPSFDLYMGLLVHPTNRNRFTACPSVRLSVRPSVRPERFPGICRRMHGGISLKFYMLMYLDHLQNWLVYGYGLLIFLILALFWLSETGQILGFQAFPGERMEEMAWNFARWCILTTFRTD